MTRAPNRKDLNRDNSTHGGPTVVFSVDTWENIQKTSGITLNETRRDEVQEIIAQYSFDKSFYAESPTRKKLADELEICGKSVNTLHHFFGVNFDAMVTERSQIVNEIKKNMQDGEVAFTHFYQYLASLKEAIEVTNKNFVSEAPDDKGGRSGDLSLDHLLVALDSFYMRAGGEHAKLKASFILAICEALPLEIRPDVSPYHETLAKRINRAHENLKKA